MKNFLLVAMMILVTGCATAKPQPLRPAQPPREETLKDDTVGAILVQVDETPEAIIFVSKTGKVLIVASNDCVEQEACTSLVEQLSSNHKAQVLVIHTAKPKTTET